MSSVDIPTMQAFLSTSYSSLNSNKLYGLLAEIDFRQHLHALGFAGRVSVGGWIARCEGPGTFGHDTVAIFPETIQPGTAYPTGRALPSPPHGLHTICATLHQIGIHSYYCAPTIAAANNPSTVTWHCTQLGTPMNPPFQPFPSSIGGFRPRATRYNFLRYATNVTTIPTSHVPEEFTKEHLRVAFQSQYLAEISDIDGIFWGQQFTYPIEIKEKTSAHDNRVGDFFGLDLGPFVKLAFFAAKRGNLHSIFVVREIDNTTTRNLVDWWYITFDTLAQYASWNPMAGGKSMQGTSSTVVKIPKAEFRPLDAAALASL